MPNGTDAAGVVSGVISLVLGGITAGVMAPVFLGAIGGVDVTVPGISPSRGYTSGISAQHATACSRKYVMDAVRTELNIGTSARSVMITNDRRRYAVRGNSAALRVSC